MNRRTLLRSAALSAFATPFLHERRGSTQPNSRWQPDGVGSRARIGVLTPDFDPVPESEITAMAPRGISVHSSRIPRRPQARGYTEAPYADDAVDRLAELAPPVVLFGYSSSSYVIGRQEENALRTRLERMMRGQLTAANAELTSLKENPASSMDFSKGVVFKVQIGAFKNKNLAKYFENNPNFGGEAKDNEPQKLTIGVFRDYWEADTFKKYMREMGVKDAWIVPYQDGQRVEIKDVLEGVVADKPSPSSK